MAGNTTNISIRMDADLKSQADALFTELGMNLTTAFNIFVRQSLREGGIPFQVKARAAEQRKRLLPCWKRKGLQKTRLSKATMTLTSYLLT